MKLSILAKKLSEIDPTISIDIQDRTFNYLTSDSRDVKQGTLFLALKGHQTHGREFIRVAIEKGAIAIFDESDEFAIECIDDIPVIKLPGLGKLASYIAKIFYGVEDNLISVVGITGTNGKTTTSHLVAMWASLLGQKSAVMGTVGNGLFGQLITSNNTTPCALTVHENLKKYANKGASLCAMEVSSHGLVQHRVEAVPFSVTAFLNLSRDHLDYHKTMDEYEAAKFRLFNELTSRFQVFNIDDAIGLKWFNLNPQAIAVSVNASLHQDKLNSRYVFAKNIVYHPKGVTILVQSHYGQGELHSPLLGEFNVHNLLTALAILLTLGYEFDALLSTASQLTPVAGRMESFSHPKLPTAVVDYAHTPDALEKALMALKIHQKGKIWCIFGCGGDRDKGKRPLMAAIAEMHADHVIVTDDNPRTEQNTSITDDICHGFLGINYQVIHDRTEAIQTAIEMADKDDLILVAGKGHEDYQIIGHTKIDYSDRKLISNIYQDKETRTVC